MGDDIGREGTPLTRTSALTPVTTQMFLAEIKVGWFTVGVRPDGSSDLQRGHVSANQNKMEKRT